jgi:predicted NUDIX family NTP pyrophosphohydrolase
MASKLSAGIVLYRRRSQGTEVLLVHPGGPFWARKDEGAWSIPKGEYEAGEDPLAAAKREFLEETGFEVKGPFVALTPLRQSSGKIISAWATEGDLDAGAVASGTFSMEWPPRSGKTVAFPEVDRALWYDPASAKRKLVTGQRPFVDELLLVLRSGRTE